MNLMLLDSNGHDAVALQQSTREPKPFFNEAQPFAVTPTVLRVDVTIVVFPVLRSSVVGRIYINTVHAAFVKVDEQLQSMKIFAANHSIIGFVLGTFRDRTQRCQCGEDWVSEPLYHH